MLTPTNGSGLPPILLGNASWTGTLAAARLLGRRGIPVVVADDHRFPPARFSRHTRRFLRCPPTDDDGFLEWIRDYGRREPGTVLYPTSDSLTYLYALHAEELRRWFRLSLPPLESILSVLDKKLLYQAAAKAGLHTPKTWFPESQDDVRAVAAEQTAPLLVKPRTQILAQAAKGTVVPEGRYLPAMYDEFIACSRFARALLNVVPDVRWPMVQDYHASAPEQIYILAGFADPAADLFAARASLKVLQWPRRVGVGLCFEEQVVEPALAEGVRKLCRDTGYTGLFQIEFIRTEGRYLLIDFNPRFYLPLAFEIARGLELPLMVYASACGDTEWLTELVRNAARQHPSGITAFCNSFGLNVLLSVQRLSGTMPLDQEQKWRRWYTEHRTHGIDSVKDPADPLPFVVYAADELYAYFRHPRSFLRRIVLDQ